MMIDELLWAQQDGLLPDPWQTIPLANVVVVRMDNVYELAASLGEDAAQRDFDELVPNVAPLAPLLWCEVQSSELRWGALLWSHLLRDEQEQSAAWESMYGAVPASLIGAQADDATLDTGAERAEIWAKTRWIVAGFVVYELPNDEVRLPRLPWHMWLDQTGRIVHRCYVWIERFAPDKDQADKDMQFQERFVNTALIGICFAHCKGVTVADHMQPRQQRRAAQRAGRPPLMTFKTLDIAPVTRILREEGHIEKTGIKHALHLCRGHFAHYTEQKPLFGKYAGTFYIPMHVRGRPEQGAVVKDYRVLAPPEGRVP